MTDSPTDPLVKVAADQRLAQALFLNSRPTMQGRLWEAADADLRAEQPPEAAELQRRNSSPQRGAQR